MTDYGACPEPVEGGASHLNVPYQVLDKLLLLRQINMAKAVMPDLIRHPVFSWIPAFAGMTLLLFEPVQ